MAKNTGEDYRVGSVTSRGQVLNPKTGLYTKRDDTTGRFDGVKMTGGPFKGVAKEPDGRKSDSIGPRSGKHGATVLGRSAATGRLVLEPATKTGSISLAAAKAAAENVSRRRKS